MCIRDRHMVTKRAEEILGYFQSAQWKIFSENVLYVKPYSVYHAHIYVRTNVHPEDLEKIMIYLLGEMHMPITRKIDRCAHYPPAAGLHGIKPQGKPFFDFFFLYDPNVTLAEDPVIPLHSSLLEKEHSLLIWTADAMKEFLNQFSFAPRCV